MGKSYCWMGAEHLKAAYKQVTENNKFSVFLYKDVMILAKIYCNMFLYITFVMRICYRKRR
jgi:hypothetical protein